MDEPEPADMLMFAWLSPIEATLDSKRPKSPAHSSPLLRAKTAFTGIRRTFSAGNKGQIQSQRVREAHEACLWLTAAGFPQYVHMFEGGEFPINLSKFQVERDHAFLEQPAIDALVRRINILNRCADLMDEIRAKNTVCSQDVHTRALSDQWTFKRKSRKWLRKTTERSAQSQSDSNPNLTVPETTPSPLLVSELRGSLSDLRRSVKTYSFLPSEDFQLFLTPPRPSGGGMAPTSSPPSRGFCSHTHALSLDGSYLEPPFSPPSTCDNFASCILDTLETSIQKLHSEDLRSHSLPDVFSATALYNGLSSTDESSPSVSVSSVLDCSKEAFPAATGVNGSGSVFSGGEGSGPLLRLNGHRVLDTEAGALLPGDHTPLQGTGSALIDDQPEVTGGAFEWTNFREGEEEGVGFKQEPGKSRSAGELPAFSEGLGERMEADLQEGSLKRSRAAKWHSFQRAHSYRQAFRPVRILIPIEELSVSQVSVLRNFSLLKLTSLLELHHAKTNVARILRSKPLKSLDYKNKRVFGVPLAVNVQHTGQPLPQTILYAIRHLRRTGLETMGLFRRAASKAKVESLKAINEANPGNTNYEDVSPYDIADMLKLYFRELPEPLLTNKLSEILIAIHGNIPVPLRLQALQAVMILMPDENREALQALLTLFKEVTDHAHSNQMDAHNLAVCLAPTLFALVPSSLLPASRKGSIKRNPGNHHSALALATSKDVLDSVACSRCLAQMIQQSDQLFMVAADMMQLCKFTYLELAEPVSYHELGLNKLGTGSYGSYVDSCVSTILKESRHRFKGWIHCESVRAAEISFRRVGDGIPLRLWRGVVSVPAPPQAILKRLWKQRHIWDGDVMLPRLVAEVDEQTEICQFVTRSMTPLAHRDHCILRSWRFDPATESYVLVSTSVSHQSATLQADIRATDLSSRYLIEPEEEGTSRLSFICRVDMKGRSSDYYSLFGPYLASSVSLVRDSFRGQDYLETPV